MTRESMVFGGVGLGLGAIIGFIAGYKALDKKVRKEYEDKLDRVTKELTKETEEKEETKEEKPGTGRYEFQKTNSPELTQEEIDAYNRELAKLRYKVDEDEINESSNEEPKEEAPDDEDIDTDDISVTKEPPKKHRAPKALGENEFDDKEPDVKFPVKDIYYFMQSELLTDDKGQPLDETDTIGNKLRGWGYMKGQGKDDIWVRNYDQGIDYHVHRKVSAIEDEFGEEQDE